VALVANFSNPEKQSTNSSPGPEAQNASSNGTQKIAEKEPSGSTKSIKFRVEIVPEIDSTTLRVQLVHKQGIFLFDFRPILCISSS
jgi:hypothetical protein